MTRLRIDVQTSPSLWATLPTYDLHQPPHLGSVLCYHFQSVCIIYKVLNYSDLKNVSNPDQWHWAALNQSDFEHHWMRNAMVSVG